MMARNFAVGRTFSLALRRLPVPNHYELRKSRSISVLPCSQQLTAVCDTSETKVVFIQGQIADDRLVRAPRLTRDRRSGLAPLLR